MTHNELVLQSEQYLRQLLSEMLPPGTPVYLFGSRSRGDAGFASDFDILLGGDVPDMLIPKLHDKIDDSFIPFKVDLAKESAISGAFAQQVLKDRHKWM